MFMYRVKIKIKLFLNLTFLQNIKYVPLLLRQDTIRVSTIFYRFDTIRIPAISSEHTLLTAKYSIIIKT